MNTKTAICVVIIFAVVLLLPFAADAQTVGVGGDAMQRFADWLSGPFVRPVLAIGFTFAGIVMMCGRHTFEGIVFCVIGAAIAVGANNLAALMTGGIYSSLSGSWQW
jgi:type IV secretory pathway VirB2 component (pilin)